MGLSCVYYMSLIQGCVLLERSKSSLRFFTSLRIEANGKELLIRLCPKFYFGIEVARPCLLPTLKRRPQQDADMMQGGYFYLRNRSATSVISTEMVTSTL